MLLLSFFIVSCEKEIGSVDLLKNNGQEIVFLLEEGDVVSFYTEMDIEYKEKPLFVYECEAYHGGFLLFKGGTDPLLTSENKNERIVNENGITYWRFTGKLDGTLKADMEGEYSVKTTFIKNNKLHLKINEARIVFKIQNAVLH